MSLVHPRVIPHVISYSADRIMERLTKYQPSGGAKEVEDIEQILNRLRVAAEAEGTEIAKLKKALEQAEREALAMRASVSWRITAPLRFFAGIFQA